MTKGGTLLDLKVMLTILVGLLLFVENFAGPRRCDAKTVTDELSTRLPGSLKRTKCCGPILFHPFEVKCSNVCFLNFLPEKLWFLSEI